MRRLAVLLAITTPIALAVVFTLVVLLNEPYVPPPPDWEFEQAKRQATIEALEAVLTPRALTQTAN